MRSNLATSSLPDNSKLVIENLLAAFGAVFLRGIHSSFPRLRPRRASPRLSVRRSLAIASSGACHCSQVSEARRIAEADRYRHSSRDGRHERKIFRQLEQVGNRQGESNIAVKRDILLLAAARLCTPLARRSVLIEEDHGDTSAISIDLRFARWPSVRASGQGSSRRSQRIDERNVASFAAEYIVRAEGNERLGLVKAELQLRAPSPATSSLVDLEGGK